MGHIEETTLICLKNRFVDNLGQLSEVMQLTIAFFPLCYLAFTLQLGFSISIEIAFFRYMIILSPVVESFLIRLQGLGQHLLQERNSANIYLFKVSN